jgi:hypothetical protein
MSMKGVKMSIFELNKPRQQVIFKEGEGKNGSLRE